MSNEPKRPILHQLRHSSLEMTITGSGLTQLHVQNHGDLLAGAVLCGTFGAMPGGLPDAQYETVIRELSALGTSADARKPSPFFGKLLAGFEAPFVKSAPNPTGSEWQTSDAEEIRLFQEDPLCGKPFSNSMTYSVIKGFHDLWIPERESRIPPPSDPDHRRDWIPSAARPGRSGN